MLLAYPQLSQLEQAHKEVVEQVSALRVEKTALLADKRRRDVEQAHLVAHLKTEKTRTIQGSARLARYFFKCFIMLKPPVVV